MNQQKQMPKRTDRSECIDVYADGAHMVLAHGMLRIEFFLLRMDSERGFYTVPASRVVIQKNVAEEIVKALQPLLSGGVQEAIASTVTKH